MGGRLDRTDRRGGSQVDPVVDVETLGMDVDLSLLLLSAQVLLRQWRTQVRALRLIADERDRLLVAPLPERLGCTGAGEPGADDDDVVDRARRSSDVLP